MANQDLEPWRNNVSSFQREMDQGRLGMSFEREVEMIHVFNELQDLVGTKILDAGCGEAEFAGILKAMNSQVIGLDGSYIQLAKGKNRFESNPPLVLADLTESLPFFENTFDAVVSRFALMYTENLVTVAKEFSRVTKPGGKLIFTIAHPFYVYLKGMLYNKDLDIQSLKKELKKPIDSLKAPRYSGMGNYGETNRGAIYFNHTPFPFYFRPTESYITPFVKNGFSLVGYKELIPSEAFARQHPDFEDRKNKPFFLSLTFRNNKP